MVKIEELIDNSDLTVLNKNLLSNFVFRAKEEKQERIKVINLIEVIARVKHLEGVAIATEEIIIYKILGKDDWDIKYPYRVIFLENGKWLKTNTISPSLDVAFLVYLEKKYLGYNSQFTDFALKMLGIKIEE